MSDVKNYGNVSNLNYLIQYNRTKYQNRIVSTTVLREYGLQINTARMGTQILYMGEIDNKG